MTIDLYPPIVLADDLSPDVGFGAEIDRICEEITDATKGFRSNKQAVVDALATKDATTRCQIARRYEELNGKDLASLMKKEFSRDFGTAMHFLAMSPDDAECAMLKKASDGLGANASVIYAILCGRTNAEMNRIKRRYFDLYTKDLGKLMSSELHGNMERLIFNCMQAGEEVYDPQYHTPDKVADDVVEIYKAGQGKWGTDEKAVFKLLCSAPPEHVTAMDRVYAEKYGYTLMKALEKELSGNLRDATLHMLGMKIKPYEAIAKLIKSACAGIGTDELLLTTCLIRYQTVMKNVMTAHIELFGKSIHDRVREETSGNYRTLLLAILNTAWPEEG